MPATATDHSTPAVGVDFPRFLPAPSTHGAPQASPAADTSSGARAAQAVQTVVALVDAQASRAQGAASAVKINFSFNGDDLAVRIELNNGVVRTQFRTDSPELRAAIATQWQAACPTVQGRELNFLQPVFSGAGGNPDAALTSDGGASHRETPPELESQTRAWSSSQLKPLSPAVSASAEMPPSLPTARHLHTFA